MAPFSRRGEDFGKKRQTERNALRLTALVLASLVMLEPASAAPAPAEKSAEIVGVWEIVKSDSNVPAGATVEFTKAGELIVTFTIDGRTITAKGSYKLDGKQIKTVMRVGGEAISEMVTIKTLTEKKLVTVDEEGQEEEFRRK